MGQNASRFVLIYFLSVDYLIVDHIYMECRLECAHMTQVLNCKSNFGSMIIYQLMIQIFSGSYIIHALLAFICTTVYLLQQTYSYNCHICKSSHVSCQRFVYLCVLGGGIHVDCMTFWGCPFHFLVTSFSGQSRTCLT